MKKIALIFPGQGSQHIGMGKNLYDKYDCAKKVYDSAEEILNYDFKNVIFNGNEEELRKTENAQVAIYVTSMAAYKVFKECCQVDPIVSVGHSLGEISALAVAGVFTFEQGLELVRNRALYMKSASEEKKGSMFAIRNMHYTTVESACRENIEDKSVFISNYNTDSQVVISGEIDKVTFLSEKLKEMGAIVTELKVSGAFHSPLMESARIKMEETLEGMQVNKFNIPVISNVTGEIYNIDSVKKNLAQHIVRPVQWNKTVQLLDSMGINASVELGSGKVLSNLISSTSSNIETYLFGKNSDIEHTVNELNIKYKTKRPNIIEKCISVAVCTKNYNENEDEYIEGVVKSFEELKNMSEQVDDINITLKEIEYSKKLITKILDTKGVPAEEKKYRLDEINRWS